MIKGDPHVSERDGTQVLVDANGDRVVIRRRTPHRQGTFHQVDIERFVDGEIRPACNVQGQRESGSWDLARRADLAAIWAECERPGCWGGDETSTDEHSAAAATLDPHEYPTLPALLRALSPDEYDQHEIDLSHFAPTGGEGEEYE